MINPADWPSICSRRARGCELWVGMERARGMALNSPRRATDDVRCIVRFVLLRTSDSFLKLVAWKCLNCEERSCMYSGRYL